MNRRLAPAVALLLLAPSLGSGQERLCNIDAAGRTEQIEVGGFPLILLHDPFVVRCDDGAELRASSGRLDQSIRELHLVGNVFFQDADQTLTANEATYNSGLGRLWAIGNVNFVNRAEGSTLRGPELEYYRATDTRPLAQVTATSRPQLTLQPRDRASDAEPLDLVADRVVIIGEDDLSAFGAVVITRTDMRATGGEARYNSTTEEMEIRQNARIESEEYELEGDVVRARMAEGALQHVHARRSASIRSEELLVTAPDLELFFQEELLRRAIASMPEGVEGGRPVATSRTFQIEADSLDANFIEQRLDEVYAVGSARGESIDTVAAPAVARTPAAGDEIELAEQMQREEDPFAPNGAGLGGVSSDWIRGDTLVAYFVPVAVAVADDDASVAEDAERLAQERADPSTAVELRKLVATGSAQSLYRMRAENEPEWSTERRNINFLVGDRIELELEEGELQIANVTGLERGIYLEANAVPAPPTPLQVPPTLVPDADAALPQAEAGD
jgi:lipopolysaccharide export system protein LptA